MTYGEINETVTGNVSPAQVDREELKERVLTQVVVFPDHFSEHAKSLCEQLLAKEVGQRMGFKNGCCDEIRAHSFFRDINWRKLNAGTIFLWPFLLIFSNWLFFSNSLMLFLIPTSPFFRYSVSSFCPRS